jgi:hypothetical protein
MIQLFVVLAIATAAFPQGMLTLALLFVAMVAAVAVQTAIFLSIFGLAYLVLWPAIRRII